jgi:hypothetical protein
VVNDGADECTEWLRHLTHETPGLDLIEHPAPMGCARAINAGLRVSSARHVLLLSSDTVVSAGFLEGLLRCAESSASIGLVGPLSNTADPRTLPGLSETHPDRPLTVDEVASIVAAASKREYPRATVAELSCLLVARDVLDEIGLLDDATFPLGHGADRDFSIRAVAAGFELAIADDVYVQVQPPAGTADDQKAVSVHAASVALRRKHGDAALPVAMRVSSHVVQSAATCRTEIPRELAALRVLFLLPMKGGSGGAHSVVQEVLAMRRLGVHAKISLATGEDGELCRIYRDYPELGSALLPRAAVELVELGRGFDVVVGTHHTCMADLERLSASLPRVLPAYYVQDYEPSEFEEGSTSWKLADASYRKAPGPLFAKTRWLAQRIHERHAAHVHQVLPSLEHAVFFPDATLKTDGVLHVAAMIRPQTKRRGAVRTMRVLGEVQRRFSDDVRIHLFGCNPTRSAFQALTRDFPFTCHGMLTRTELAALLRGVHVFVDLSDFQPFGRLGLEAMASGCAVVVPAEGGTTEYAVHGENAIVVDTSDEPSCLTSIEELLRDRAEINRLRGAGLSSAAAFSSEKAALSQLQFFVDAMSNRPNVDARSWAAASDSRVVHVLRRRAEFADSLTAFRRKGRKLVRQPEAFFADAKSSLMRRVGALVFRR